MSVSRGDVLVSSVEKSVVPSYNIMEYEMIQVKELIRAVQDLVSACCMLEVKIEKGWRSSVPVE